MRTRSPAMVALTVLALAAAQAPSLAASPQHQLGAAKQQNVKKLEVRSAAEVRRVFGLRAGRRTQAIEISCSPASSDWCAKDFVTACDNAGGGMSSDPDGGVTCSLPNHE